MILTERKNPEMDRNHPEPHVASKNCILKLSEAHELSDVWRVFHKSHRQYTWVHTKDNLLSMARLDRFYCFKHHLNVFRSSFISPVGFSDHSLVQCSVFIKQIQSGSAYWHFNTSLLSDGNFKDVFNFFWKNFSETKSLYSSLQQWWDIGKSQIQKLCLQYTFNVSKNMARSIRALEREVVELQAFADSTGERGHIENLKTKRSVLADLLGTSARGAVVRSRFQNVALMDAPSHFFFGLERKNGQRRQMMSLRSHTGQLLQESADIRRFAASFYGDLFKSEYTENPEVSRFFYADLPKVSEDANAELGNEISSEELYAALQGLRGGTSPGIDGLPADFYKTFWSVLGGDLLMVLNDSVKKGRLPQSCRRAVLTLLPKKGELQDIKNWRPVSLLCTDYKLLSKVLANRMRKVMEQVIHVDQTYCVPGRLVTDNIALIRDVVDLSSSLGLDLGLISIDQQKAFDRVEHMYLWQTLRAFGFNPGLIAQIQALYGDIESVLKINGGLSAPFKVGRGVRQGCPLSGMLYSLALEPFLHKLRTRLSGFNLPGSNSFVKLSAYADDVIVLVQKQSDIDSLVDSVENFGLISSSKVNWEKSEALMVGDGLKQLSLPGRLTWKKGGIKYLGVYLGDPTTVSKNWENVLEKAEGKLKKWKWILPKLSFRGRVLVINNLIASMLWHRLYCVDPPANLLSNIQRVIVDFFWDHLHWIPQSVLFLAKDDGGQGLIHLASRGAVFRLQHIQRLLTGPADLVWRPVARAILGQGGGQGLTENLFLMDLQNRRLSGLSDFYQGLFRVWGMFKKRRPLSESTLYWILKEPVVYGLRFKTLCGLGTSMMERFVSSGVVTLGQLVRLCGPKLEMVSALASQLGVFSERLLANQLRVWRDQLSQTEQNLLVSYCQGSVLPTDSDPFPAITLTPDFKDCSGVLLNCAVPGGANLNVLTGKMMYQLLVKMVNKAKLGGRTDTPWRSHLGLSAEVRPQWRALYKTPLTRKVGDLQ